MAKFNLKAFVQQYGEAVANLRQLRQQGADPLSIRDESVREARRLFRQSTTADYDEIGQALGVTQAAISGWVRNEPAAVIRHVEKLKRQFPDHEYIVVSYDDPAANGYLRGTRRVPERLRCLLSDYLHGKQLPSLTFVISGTRVEPVLEYCRRTLHCRKCNAALTRNNTPVSAAQSDTACSESHRFCVEHHHGVRTQLTVAQACAPAKRGPKGPRGPHKRRAGKAAAKKRRK